MIRYRAAWVLPVSRPPLAGGVVTVDGGRIVSIDHQRGGGDVDLGSVAILPALVNAHTHLELSWMRNRVPPASSMPAWASTLIAERGRVPRDASDAIRAAIAEARRSGTTLVGDIGNTLAAYDPLVESDLSAVLFRELLGFSMDDPEARVAEAAADNVRQPPIDRVRLALAPHAPYSVSPALMMAIVTHAAGRQPISIHVAESSEEVQFLGDGSGLWRRLLETLGVWTDAWTPPACGAVEYLDRLGLLRSNLIAVHGVQLTDAELGRLAAADATLVTCPRSNRWTGAGDPPVERFYASGVRVAVGTDSLASVDDLNLFAELTAIRRLAPSLPARTILRSATLSGAEALGFAAELGTLNPGKRARLITVRLPADLADVEEYLLSGIEPGEILWLDPA